jgi:NADPH:quinone reductase-like Zn-dependent oxidoreductase
MKAVRFHEYGDPGVLRYEDVEQPVPGAGQVRVRVAATSFNPIDASVRAGNMRGPMPLAPAEVLTSAPKSVPLSEAAALPVVGLTAYQALFDHGKLTAGQRVLVNGAGGAVGGYAVQLAKNAGAHVIATASPRSAAGVKAADEVIDHTTASVTAAVTEPVDVVLNLAPVDPEQLAALVTLVRPGGVLVNTTVWMPAPSDEERGVRGINLFVRSDADQLAKLVALADRGELHIDVADRVPLAELPALHARAAEGAVHGKVVVLPPTA